MKFKVASLQFDIVLGHPDQNLATAERMIRQAADLGAQMICLPELFTTGFDYEAIRRHYSQSDHAALLGRLSELSRSLGIFLICGSLVEKEEGKFYNTSYLFNDQGTLIGKYRKIHLFSPMSEDIFFTPGREIPIFETSLAKIGLAICYDLRFPALFAELARKEAEIVFIPAQFPHPRLDHWRILLRARAIEDHFFVVGCNRVGSSGKQLFCGHSSLLSPWGETLAEAGEREGIAMSLIDLSLVLESRLFFQNAE